MADIVDFKIDQGATWRSIIVLCDENDDPVNLTGFSARMQIKRLKHNQIAVATLTTENGSIAIEQPLTGEISLLLTETQTEELGGNYYYDLEIVSAGEEVTRVIEGRVLISEEVTRDGN